MSNQKELQEFISEAKLLLQSQNYEEALDILLEAIKIYPTESSLIINIGNIHKHRDRPRQAENYYKRAIEINESKEAYNNLAVLYLDANLIDLAISCSMRAIEIDSNYIDARYNAALALQRNGQYSSAIDQMSFIMDINPDHSKVLVSLYNLYQHTCSWDEISSIEKKLDSMIGNGEEHPFMGISRSDSLENNYKIAISYAQKNINPAKEVSIPQFIGGGMSGVEKNKIKIGYLCGEFRDHPTYHLTKNLFKSHNSNEFEIYLFSFRHDEKTKNKLKEDVFKFIDITDLTDASAAEIIRSYALDILIDLTVVISSNRINILKDKPAKNIISYLGYPGTSGYSFYDYILTDEIVSPKHHQSFYTEKFLYLPCCYQVNDGVSDFSDSKKTRKMYSLPESATVLACFNQSYKLDFITFKCWLEILDELPDSVIWLLKDNDLSQKNLIKFASERNIEKNRIIFADKTPRDEHLDRLKLADLILDTSIYNGHTTTTDALKVGVPVVTKTGEHFASRVSTSLLCSLDLDELCCSDLTSYKNKVIELCTNTDARKKILDKLTVKNKYKEVHNTKAFAKCLENVLVKIL
jgi:protein O-GlcNAc transferase